MRGLALMPEPGQAAMVRWEWPPGTSWRASYAKTHPVSAPGEIEIERVVSWLEPRPDGLRRHYACTTTVHGPDGRVLRRERLRTEDRHAAPWNSIVLATWDLRTEILGLEIERLTPAQARVQAALMERPAEDPLPAF